MEFRDAPSTLVFIHVQVGKKPLRTGCVPCLAVFLRLLVVMLCTAPAQEQPRFYNDITIRVGTELDVSDLIAAHEAEHGPLWKYSPSSFEGGRDDEVRSDQKTPSRGAWGSGISCFLRRREEGEEVTDHFARHVLFCSCEGWV